MPMLSVGPGWYRPHRCGADGPIHHASACWSRATNASRMAKVADSLVTLHASGPSLNFDCVAGVGSARLNGGIEVELPSQRRVFPRHLLAIRLSHDIIAHSNQDGIEILVRRFKLPYERTSKR